MNVFELICKQLREQGEMTFAQYMQQALYAPGVGYYSSGLEKLGSHGDFITAPELTPLFGYTLANQCYQILPCLDSPIIFEFGAGSGRLCVDLLTRLESLGSLPEEYHILEVSSQLRQRQQQLLAKELPHFIDRIRWLSTWPTTPFQGIVIANEVLDAMPVHRFAKTEQAVLEAVVVLNDHGALSERFQPCLNERLIQYVDQVLPQAVTWYQSEVNLFLDAWMQSCSDMLKKGAFFIIDYGFPRHEYYHPDRTQGTLMCHYRHQAHTNPFAHPGEEDITAHVDFTQVAQAAFAAGFTIAGYTNQASFLLGNGLLHLLENYQEPRERLRTQQAAKQLLQPSEMGELFKVIGLTKQVDLVLNGFQLSDKRASL